MPGTRSASVRDAGVSIGGSSASGNTVLGNFIGTDAAGDNLDNDTGGGLRERGQHDRRDGRQHHRPEQHGGNLADRLE